MMISAILLGTLLLQRSEITELKTTDPKADLSDLRAIGGIFDGKMIVGMGEATHGTREFFRMKHRVFRYLVEDKGFTIFALEASMPDCLAMDEYVTKGKGNAKLAVSLQGFWTWNTQEVVEMIEWMREYNVKNPDKPQLRVVGYDMQSPLTARAILGTYAYEAEGTTLVDAITARDYRKKEDAEWLRTTGESLAKKLGEKGQPEKARYTDLLVEVVIQSAINADIAAFRELQMAAVPEMPTTFPDAAKLLAELKDIDESATTALNFIKDHASKTIDIEGFGRAKFAKFAKECKESMTALANSKSGELTERLMEQALLWEFLASAASLNTDNILNYRDECMAQNIDRIHRKTFAGQKVFAWAHNGHVMKHSSVRQFTPMGKYLQDMAGGEQRPYLCIGFTFLEGSFTAVSEKGRVESCRVGAAPKGTLEQVLSEKGKNILFVPTAGMAAEVKSRTVGALYRSSMDQAYIQPMIPEKAFDYFIYIKNSSATKVSR